MGNVILSAIGSYKHLQTLMYLLKTPSKMVLFSQKTQEKWTMLLSL